MTSQRKKNRFQQPINSAINLHIRWSFLGATTIRVLAADGQWKRKNKPYRTSDKRPGYQHDLRIQQLHNCTATHSSSKTTISVPVSSNFINLESTRYQADIGIGTITSLPGACTCCPVFPLMRYSRTDLSIEHHQSCATPSSATGPDQQRDLQDTVE